MVVTLNHQYNYCNNKSKLLQIQIHGYRYRYHEGSKAGEKSRWELLLGSSQKCREMPTVSSRLCQQVIFHTFTTGDPTPVLQFGSWPWGQSPHPVKNKEIDVKATLLSVPVTIKERDQRPAGDDCIILMDSSMRNVGESGKETYMRIGALTRGK